jgi:hypothetical protein
MDVTKIKTNGKRMLAGKLPEATSRFSRNYGPTLSRAPSLTYLTNFVVVRGWFFALAMITADGVRLLTQRFGRFWTGAAAG